MFWQPTSHTRLLLPWGPEATCVRFQIIIEWEKYWACFFLLQKLLWSIYSVLYWVGGYLLADTLGTEQSTTVPTMMTSFGDRERSLRCWQEWFSKFAFIFTLQELQSSTSSSCCHRTCVNFSWSMNMAIIFFMSFQKHPNAHGHAAQIRNFHHQFHESWSLKLTSLSACLIFSSSTWSDWLSLTKSFWTATLLSRSICRLNTLLGKDLGLLGHKRFPTSSDLI